MTNRKYEKIIIYPIKLLQLLSFQSKHFTFVNTY